jgi:hypothetical protein
MKKDNNEIFLGGGHLNIQSANYVQTYNSLQLITSDDGSIELNVEIKADFSKIPEKYHEVFLNMFSSKYVGVTSFGDNPFSICKPTLKKKWYQFWKKIK